MVCRGVPGAVLVVQLLRVSLTAYGRGISRLSAHCRHRSLVKKIQFEIVGPSKIRGSL